MAKERHTMTKVRWTLLAIGTAALAITCLISSDVTVLFTAGMAYGLGVLVLIASERIIARTRSHPQVQMANARQGIR